MGPLKKARFVATTSALSTNRLLDDAEEIHYWGSGFYVKTHIRKSDNEVCVANEYRDINEYWTDALSEPMRVSSFIRFLEIFILTPALDGLIAPLPGAFNQQSRYTWALNSALDVRGWTSALIGSLTSMASRPCCGPGQRSNGC